MPGESHKCKDKKPKESGFINVDDVHEGIQRLKRVGSSMLIFQRCVCRRGSPTHLEMIAPLAKCSPVSMKA